jgi:hypothetical protein
MKTKLSSIIFALLVAATSSCTKSEKSAVLGYSGSANLYEDSKLGKELSLLELGAEVAVLSAQDDDIVNVKTAKGQQGWLRRCWLCSPTELNRRKAADEVPKNICCIKAEGERKLLYGGALSIQDGAPAVMEGDAFWLDPMMKGKEFSIGGTKIIGDPSVLVLYKGHDKMVTLKIWTVNPNTTPSQNK